MTPLLPEAVFIPMLNGYWRKPSLRMRYGYGLNEKNAKSFSKCADRLGVLPLDVETQ